MKFPRESDLELRNCPRLKIALSYRSSYGVGQLEDISIFGICFRSKEKIKIGQEIELDLIVPEEAGRLFGELRDNSLRLRVEVAWCEKVSRKRQYICGGRISAVQDDEYGDLMAFLFGEATALANTTKQELHENSIYRNLAEAISDPICVIQKERMVYTNEVMCTSLGEEPDKLHGQLFANWIAPNQVDSWYRFLRDVETNKQDEEILHLTLISSLDRRIEFEMHTKMFVYQNKPALLAVLRDVSARKEFEQKLIQAEKMRALGEMAGGVAHDFNNILGGILGRTQLLLMQTKEGQLRKGLEIIEKLTLDGAKTVRRIQEFTRMRRDRNFKEFDLNKLIRQTIGLTRNRWKDETLAAGLDVEVTFNSQPLPKLQGNAEELREVISNLIFNAVDALPDGGTIIISTTADKNNVFMQVSDNGVGMTDDVLWRVFEPFFTTKQYRGSGLGLSIAYSIISRHDGEILIDSKPGIGTTVSVVFHQNVPVGQAGVENNGASETKEIGLSDIIIIDDDEGIRDSLHELLAARGFKVRSYARGREAVEAFSEKPCDIVITDLGIPDISGWEVAKRIKGHTPSTKVILITGWGVQLEDVQVQEKGIDHVLTKPFHSIDILGVIDGLGSKKS